MGDDAGKRGTDRGTGASTARRGKGGRARVLARRLCQGVSLGLFAWLLFHVVWPHAERFTPTVLSDKEHVPAELFLLLDPLSATAAALAGRLVSAALLWTAAVLVVCLFVPRGFCSHVCPLGTLIDLADWPLGLWRRLFRVRWRGPWVHAKFLVLAFVLAAALWGVMLAGYVAAIPVLTRGGVFVLGPVQVAWLKHAGVFYHTPGVQRACLYVLAGVFGLCLLGRRFWCRSVCPTGACFSLGNLLRVRERRVGGSCTRCGRCARACSFGAIRDDFSTRPMDCTFCGTCAKACPVDAIEFGWRWSGGARLDGRGEGRVSRRAFFGAAAAGVAAAAGGAGAASAVARRSEQAGAGTPLLRPPGSVREDRFLELCVRCGLCMKVCPGPVLYPAGPEAGPDALWTPVAALSRAACHQDCNFCGQVCPTGAIRPLSLPEKRRTAMGLAVIDTATCLPHRFEKECDACVRECQAAGYDAIALREITQEIPEIDPAIVPLEYVEEAGTIKAPFVDPVACVGCGACEHRCPTAWTGAGRQPHLSSILVAAENEDRPGW